MIWILFVLVVAGGIAILTWDIRRKTAAREAASKKRFEEMFLARPAAGSAPASVPAAAPGPSVGPVEGKPVAPAFPAPERGRFLDRTQTLIYRLLKVAIPDHEVFANVALASVTGSKNEQEARRLSQFRLDFVVCDKSMQVVAVVEMEASGGLQAAGEQRFKADSLKAAGIRLVRVDSARLPRREEIRELVCGQSVSTVKE